MKKLIAAAMVALSLLTISAPSGALDIGEPQVVEYESRCFTNNIYPALLGRAPDTGGQLYFEAHLNAGTMTDVDVAWVLLNSAEYPSSPVASMTRGAFIIHIFQTMLNRAPSNIVEFTHWQWVDSQIGHSNTAVILSRIACAR